MELFFIIRRLRQTVFGNSLSQSTLLVKTYHWIIFTGSSRPKNRMPKPGGKTYWTSSGARGLVCIYKYYLLPLRTLIG